ncbi:polyphosphate polymerase domain-containing protein [Gemella sp. GH3]|uniref:polyphosphate polymerase domain-containing protein n=1 Tax=unclassified Gemella TaxID=2624949 RepID=UPI0015CFCB40|nr:MULTISPECIES: polyphosphate polymerase domain-containing protein [unclassified Gemella]MBF0713381.1 polyphosphate polymerase domain-containing protein [Gemella sp. GH3.1]NYS50333.1 polyphosphate polymerase domain-containing protein [Gemella sp. GH3]
MAKNTFKSKFKRYEKKYLITLEQLNSLKQYFDKYLIADDYASSTISNLYFDTENFYMIRSAKDKAEYKEKLRMRSYDKYPNDDSKVFLEIKKKYEKVIYKRRIATSLRKGNEYLLHRHNVLGNSQIKNEIDWLFQTNKSLKPMMYIYYDRYSYKGKDNEDLRITIDSNIKYRNYDLDIKKGIYGNNIIDDNLVIMEIKVSGAYPIWLSEALNKYEMYPRGFSKYGTAYQKLKERGLENAKYVI